MSSVDDEREADFKTGEPEKIPQGQKQRPGAAGPSSSGSDRKGGRSMTPEHQPGRRLTLLAGYRLRSADRRQSIKRDHARPGDPTVRSSPPRGPRAPDLVVARAAEHRVTVADIVGRARGRRPSRAHGTPSCATCASLGLSSVEVGTLLRRTTPRSSPRWRRQCAVDTTPRGRLRVI